MKTFKEFLYESKEADMEKVSGAELQQRMGKKDFNGLIKSKQFSYLKSKEQVIKYGVTSTGMHKIEVYPYHPDIKDEDGKIAIHSRHDFIVYNGKIAHYQKMSRSSNKDTTWR